MKTSGNLSAYIFSTLTKEKHSGEVQASNGKVWALKRQDIFGCQLWVKQ